MQQMHSAARARGCSLYEATEQLLLSGEIKGKLGAEILRGYSPSADPPSPRAPVVP